ncbi:hypothetical protein, partial [Klebsiella pneumoniae]|uniref:hypothetical protein n=1 Tax=Klebsiella pneumoniae TaxID=573 RepID=UPI00272FD93F
WINGQTEEVPQDLAGVRFRALNTPPWVFLLFFGTSAGYEPATRTFAFHRNLRSLPVYRRLNVVGHELNHYLIHRHGLQSRWRRVPV